MLIIWRFFVLNYFFKYLIINKIHFNINLMLTESEFYVNKSVYLYSINSLVTHKI